MKRGKREEEGDESEEGREEGRGSEGVSNLTLRIARYVSARRGGGGARGKGSGERGEGRRKQGGVSGGESE